jgi:hypothetical protein
MKAIKVNTNKKWQINLSPLTRKEREHIYKMLHVRDVRPMENLNVEHLTDDYWINYFCKDGYIFSTSKDKTKIEVTYSDLCVELCQLYMGDFCDLDGDKQKGAELIEYHNKHWDYKETFKADDILTFGINGTYNLSIPLGNKIPVSEYEAKLKGIHK